ncbi:MAG: sterol carrier family protein [Aurantimicrobium sp.]|uniref:sterol carrier family protein n=1 Tax=Aurantimicrobium sp. TaxID=1930784 RepID=UPI002FC6BFA5
MAKPRVDSAEGHAAVTAVLAGSSERTDVASAVRYLLQLMGDATPGHTVELRVPPFGAIQCVEGPEHTRGTPPNVVEMDPPTWIALATGSLSWAEAYDAGKISASGVRSDLSSQLPLAQW